MFGVDGNLIGVDIRTLIEVCAFFFFFFTALEAVQGKEKNEKTNK